MTSQLTEIDHVAIAVNDIDAAIAWYESVFGAVVVHREVVESDGVDEALVKVAESYIQLLTPTRDDSPVAKYLAKNGEGQVPLSRVEQARLEEGNRWIALYQAEAQVTRAKLAILRETGTLLAVLRAGAPTAP